MCVVGATEVGDEVVVVSAREGQPPSRAGSGELSSRVSHPARRSPDELSESSVD